jgi:hypothetical protein
MRGFAQGVLMLLVMALAGTPAAAAVYNFTTGKNAAGRRWGHAILGLGDQPPGANRGFLR